MPDAVQYTRWDDIPSHLQTRTQLARQGLRPARGQSPVATMRNQLRPQDPYELYDQVAAILQGASRIVAWNSAFDYFTLQCTCALAEVGDLAQATDKRWTC